MRASESAAGWWRERIESQRTSGLTVAEYCRRERVNRAGWFQWRRKLGYGEERTAPLVTPRRRGAAARSYWEAVIAEQAASGESVAAWCRQRKIWAPSFFSWKRRLGAGASRPAVPSAAFVEVTGAPSARLVLESTQGWRIAVARGFDAELLREVIAAFREAR